MRLFVAVDIEAGVAEGIMALGAELRRRVEARAPAARLTWATRDRLHLTLRFIGETGQTRANEIRAALKPPIGQEPFELSFDGAGAFPSRGAPRALWVGIERGEAALVALEREVTARLEPCGIPPEVRPFRPHLTLARVREASGLKGEALFDGLPRVRGASPVRTITLFQSQLLPAGPTYLALQSTSLRWKN